MPTLAQVECLFRWWFTEIVKVTCIFGYSCTPCGQAYIDWKWVRQLAGLCTSSQQQAYNDRKYARRLTEALKAEKKKEQLAEKEEIDWSAVLHKAQFGLVGVQLIVRPWVHCSQRVWVRSACSLGSVVLSGCLCFAGRSLNGSALHRRIDVREDHHREELRPPVMQLWRTAG